MNGPVLALVLIGLAVYLYFMSAVGKWLARSRDSDSVLTPAAVPAADRGNSDTLPVAREPIAM